MTLAPGTHLGPYEVLGALGVAAEVERQRVDPRPEAVDDLTPGVGLAQGGAAGETEVVAGQ